MSHQRKKAKKNTKAKAIRHASKAGTITTSLPPSYSKACQLALQGQTKRARRLYQVLDENAADVSLRALVRNDLAVLHALDGNAVSARAGLHAALELDADCAPARANLALLQPEESSLCQPLAARVPVPAPKPAPPENTIRPSVGQSMAPKVAILSFLFNWPSTGGGIVHTVELACFLARAGFDVKHFYARYPDWGIGRVEGPLPHASEALDFCAATLTVAQIQERFRQAVAAFHPDHVIITDSWNMKPLLAEAVKDHPYILRFQAMECLCPLNNVRLLPREGGGFRQCHLQQLANPEECARCLSQWGQFSGQLHQEERALSGAGTPDYHRRLLQVVKEAEAVLVVNPDQEAMFKPFANDVRVVPSGFDPSRFPWPWPTEPDPVAQKPLSILFAGLVHEVMKGFGVLHEACALLWQHRQDFELLATADPPRQLDAFTRFVGWQSQEDLPRRLRSADIVAFPTVAQEALGRTAVEAMAVGRPVVASRLGGLRYTVVDGVTGLLCEPGDPQDLAHTLERLLDDPELRQRLGQAGRQRFEEHYTWDVLIERHYRPLLSCKTISRLSPAAPSVCSGEAPGELPPHPTPGEEGPGTSDEVPNALVVTAQSENPESKAPSAA